MNSDSEWSGDSSNPFDPHESEIMLQAFLAWEIQQQNQRLTMRQALSVAAARLRQERAA